MTESGERADSLEGAADELEGWSPQEDEPDLGAAWCEDHEDEDALDEVAEGMSIEDAREACDLCQEAQRQARQEWWDALLDEAEAAVGEASF